MACFFFWHQWNGCSCLKCGAKRDVGHAWDLCSGRCLRCGKEQEPQHDWIGCICQRCGCIRKDRVLNESDLVRAIHNIDSKSTFLDNSDKKIIVSIINKISNATLLSELAFGDASNYVRFNTIVNGIEKGKIAPTEEQLAEWATYVESYAELRDLARSMLCMRGLKMESPAALYQLYMMTEDANLAQKIVQKLLSIGDVEILTRLATVESFYKDNANLERLVNLLPVNSICSIINSLAGNKCRWLEQEGQKHRYDAVVNAVRTALSAIPDDDILINLYRSGSLMSSVDPEPLKFVKSEKKLVELLCSESARNTAHLMRRIDFPISQDGLKEIALTFANKPKVDPYLAEIVNVIIPQLDDAELVKDLKAAIYIDPSTIRTPFFDDHKY